MSVMTDPSVSDSTLATPTDPASTNSTHTDPLALPTVRQVAELRSRLAEVRRAGLSVALVPTMGALHEGHLSLVRRARQEADIVVTSIFVNPAQFGPGEDLDSYPRDVPGDARRLAEAGCDLLFLPDAQTIYPPGHSTWVETVGPDQGFEGSERPGHFRGVATVVTQLFNLVQPDVAVFGQKDAQQLAVVRKLVRDLHLPVRIVPGPIVREDDGLAMSSRNVYLDVDQRRAATVLYKSLQGIERRLRRESLDAQAIRTHIAEQIETEPLARLDYVAVVRADDFAPVERLEGQVVIALAVRFGQTRLLDNLHLDIS